MTLKSVRIDHPIMRYQRFINNAMKIDADDADPFSLMYSIRYCPVGQSQEDVRQFAAWVIHKASDSDEPYETIKTIFDACGFANRFIKDKWKCSRQECLSLVRWCTDRMEDLIIDD